MTATTTSNSTLSSIARDPGPWSQAYLDVSVDTADPPGVVEQRITSVGDALRRAGAPDADVAAVTAALDADAPAPSPLCHFVLARRGEVVVDEWMPGIASEPELVSFGPVPDLTPLLERQAADFSFVVVETERDGGEIRLYRVGAPGVDDEQHVQGRTDTLHAVKTGGWRQSRLQSHAREIWRQTQSQLAGAVDEVVRRERPRLLVIAGDIRARHLLEDELSAESRAILVVEPTDTRAPGSDQSALTDRVEAEIQRILAADKAEVLDRVAMHEGRGDQLVTTRFGEVVRALASAQVDTLLLDADRLGDRTVLALDREPWIATAPEDALEAQTLATVPARVGLVRAAVLTDARVLHADSVSVPDGADAVQLPGDAPAAAVLRWPLGPTPDEAP
jgi:hypothetical protein